MTTWNQLSEAEQLHCIYSDTHKDVFGFRPRHMTPEQVASVEWLKNAIAKLDEMPLDEDDDYEDDGQPSEYDEWQDVYGGDDWDHGQYDDYFDGGIDF